MPDQGKVVLTVPFGEGEQEIALKQARPSPAEFFGPTGFTVSDTGEIYIVNYGILKVFKDNALQSVLQYSPIDAVHPYVPVLMFHDLALHDGVLYLANTYKNRVYTVVSGEVTALALGYMDYLRDFHFTRAGKLVINAPYNAPQQVQITRNGQTSEVTVIRSDNPYHEDSNGNQIRYSYSSVFRQSIFEKLTPDGKVLDFVALDINYEYNWNIIGTDQQGRVYIDTFDYNYWFNQNPDRKRFLIRLDIDKKELLLQQVNDRGNVNGDALLTGSIFHDPEVDANGNVYLAFGSVEDGLKIVKYSFEN
ncbi:MAG TPA: hypothetical protein GX701_03705 [Clostridiales bacterium]|jgi:hypothetical protein|nr:hypothetical protein [Clostridiales bacterium]